jgi:hypothetical protein
MTLTEFSQRLESSGVATAIAESDWLFPALESVHVIAVTTVLGSIAIIDLRLLSLMSRKVAIGRLMASTLPVTWAAFVVAVISGASLFASAATDYLENALFRYKLLLMLVAGANMIVFHFITGRRLDEWHASSTPLAAKAAGMFSLSLWIGTVVLGRWIAFA